MIVKGLAGTLDMALCGAKTRAGTACRLVAGWATDHVGRGRCKLHGGASPGAPIIHGRYSVKHRQSLQKKMEQFLNDPAPTDLRDELALMRALLQDFLDRFPEGAAMTAINHGHIMGMVDAIGKIVERIARILHSEALTAAEVSFLQARIVDLLGKYIDDPGQRIRFIDELANAIPGGHTRTNHYLDTGE